MKNSIDLFDDMMQKHDDTKPEPVIVDDSPDAEGMDPELFNDILDGIQEIVDIESGKIDESEYDVQMIRAHN